MVADIHYHDTAAQKAKMSPPLLHAPKKPLLTPLALIFFISGFSALLYQVIWQRLLGLFSGSDVRSVTIVVSAFLGGLGVGSLVGAIWADKLSSRQAIRLFGLCNLGIAGFALISRWLYYDVLFQRLAEWAHSSIALLLIAFISLLWPTVLMGMSLPLLSKAVVQRLEEAARRISLLDGLNTVGAGLGALGTGWYLAGTYGYETTLWIGAGLSGFVGLTAVLLASQFSADDKSTAATTTSFSLRGVAPEVWRWCALTFASGFMAISLELIWFRLLDVSLKSNAYTFAYLLAFFLAGDGVGTLIAIRFLRHAQRPRQLFLWIIAFVSLYSLAAVWFLTHLARTYAPFTNYVAQTEGLLSVSWEAPPETWLIYLAFPVLLMLVPTILFGFYFPMVQQGVQQDVAQVGQRVGLIKLANIFGNAMGGIVTGLVFLEYWGSGGALRIIGGLGLLFALFLLHENWGNFGRLPRLAGAGLGITLIALTLLFPTNHQIWAALHGAQAGDLFLSAEDSTGVAAVRQTPSQPAIMFANGQSQATIPFLSLHGLLGALPVLVHPAPHDVLIIGIGSAGTPYAAGANPATQRITAVEIIGSELDVLDDYQHHPGGQPLANFFADERYEIVIGDGRRELALADQFYDVIQADAIRPTGSHSGLLYSAEFFTAVRDQLAPGGLMAQWRATDRVEATFTAVFPYVVNVGNIVLLGSNDPIPYDSQAVLAMLTDPAVEAYMRAGSYNVHEMRPWVEPPPYFWFPDSPRPSDPINTDLHPRDEYYLSQKEIHAP